MVPLSTDRVEESYLTGEVGFEGAMRFVDDMWERVGRTPSPRASEVDLLVHRSRALGADLRVTNFGGGNTSCKTTETDPITGEAVEVLWIKGSGGDLGTLTREGLASLSLPALVALKARYRGEQHEDEMAELFLDAMFGRDPVVPSIDTPLHAFVPYRHADHLHPDAVIAIAAAADGERLTKEIYGEDAVWIPWRRPGWALGLVLEGAVQEHPGARGAVLGGHGLISWGDTAEECYSTSLELIERASAFLDEHSTDDIFGPVVIVPLADVERRTKAAELAPVIRGLVSTDRPVVGRFTDAPDVLDFMAREKGRALAALGTSCPDHFLRTKVRPLWAVAEADTLREAHANYRASYTEYYETNRTPDSPPMRGADPAVVLVPGVGMWSFGPDARAARIAGEYFVNAINVMRGAEAVSSYAPISDAEKFRIEYWSLEEAKLRRFPPPKPLTGRVALVVGGASGIGRACAERLSAEGACVVVADRDGMGAEALTEELGGSDAALAVAFDVTDEEAVRAAVESACLGFGGVDIVLQSAGFSISHLLAETTIEEWDLQHGVMARGSFLVAREAARAIAAQGMGGDIVLVVSKNAVVAGPSNVAYGAAKAAQAHLVRLLAAELGPHKIRVNGVNPDAVVRGSGIFAGEWGAERAKVHGVSPEELGRYYAERTLLKEEILPEDVAAAVFALVSGDLRKTTGTIIPVDGGIPAAFPR